MSYPDLDANSMESVGAMLSPPEIRAQRIQSPTSLEPKCGAGLYRSLVRFRAIRCETDATYKHNINNDLNGYLLEGATPCKAVENGLKIRRPLRSWGSIPLPAPRISYLQPAEPHKES